MGIKWDMNKPQSDEKGEEDEHLVQALLTDGHGGLAVLDVNRRCHRLP